MKMEGMELSFSVSALDVSRIGGMLAMERLRLDLPAITSLYFRILPVVFYPFDWIAELWAGNDPGAGKGIRHGAQRLIAEPDGLTLRRDAHSVTYRWAAIRDLRKTRKMILIMITPAHAIPVPRRAFADRAEERRFCDFVHDRIASGAGHRDG